MTAEELGKKIYSILGISKGETVVISRDRLSQNSLLITREESEP